MVWKLIARHSHGLHRAAAHLRTCVASEVITTLSEGSSFLFSLINEIIEWFLRVP